MVCDTNLVAVVKGSAVCWTPSAADCVLKSRCDASVKGAMSLTEEASALRVGKGGDEAATLVRKRFSASLSVALMMAV